MGWLAAVGWLHGRVYARTAVARLERVAVIGAAVAFVTHLAIIVVVKQSNGALDLD